MWGGLEVACPGAKGERCVWVCGGWRWPVLELRVRGVCGCVCGGLEVACPGAKGERCVWVCGGWRWPVLELRVRDVCVCVWVCVWGAGGGLSCIELRVRGVCGCVGAGGGLSWS